MEIIKNELGGMQTNINARFDLIPPKATIAKAEIYAKGAKKYSPNNWKLVSIEDHINHALRHVYLYLDTGIMGHLKNASVRLDMALDNALTMGGNNGTCDSKDTGEVKG